MFFPTEIFQYILKIKTFTLLPLCSECGYKIGKGYKEKGTCDFGFLEPHNILCIDCVYDYRCDCECNSYSKLCYSCFKNYEQNSIFRCV